MHCNTLTQKVCLGALIWLIAVTTGHAAGLDLRNLEQNFPLQMQDASALPAHAVSADVAIDMGFDNGHDLGEWSRTWSQVDYGFGGGLQGSVGVRTISSDIDETGTGDVYLKALKEAYSGPHDALAVQAEVNLPTGRNYAWKDRSDLGTIRYNDPRQQTVDFSLGAVYTRVLCDKPLTRLHLQVARAFIDSAEGSRQNGRWFLSAGADRDIGRDTLAMVNVLWEETAWRGGKNSTVLQLGLRNQLGPRFICGLGFSAGMGWENADYALNASAQYGF